MNNNHKGIRIIQIIATGTLGILIIVGSFIWLQAGTNAKVERNTTDLAKQDLVLQEVLEFKAELKTDIKWIIKEIGEIQTTLQAH